MNRIASALLALPLLLPVLVHAQPAVDERAIISAVNALDAAIDTKDWQGAREFLLDEVSIAFPDEEAATIPAEALVERWRAELHEDKASFHLRGGERVTFDGADSAVLRSKAQLWEHLPGIAGEDRYERWADYHHELDRGEDGEWRVRHYGYLTRLERGNLAVLEHRLPAPPEPETVDGDAATEAAAEETATDDEADAAAPNDGSDGEAALDGDDGGSGENATEPEPAPADADAN